MSHSDPKIFAPSKVDIHHERIEAYLKGEKIYPVTIEIDLTQRCTRNCPGCPYGVARQPGLTLELPFLDKLFSILGPHTPGIVLSGGEPTFTPHFAETTKLAKEKGFKEIAVISNGTLLHLPKVQDALLQNVTALRVSMYEWQEGESEVFLGTLAKIAVLKERAKKEGSNLQIGASMLTRTEWVDRIKPVGLRVLESGIDWLYFHPYCVDWEEKHPKQADQSGVLEAIAELKQAAPAGTNIQVPLERYSKEPLFFTKLHGAHFLIQVGADGINYAGPECKYEKEYALLDLNQYLEPDFLWHPERIKRINAINSDNYVVIGTKHRPPMFSDYIEKVKQTKELGHQTTFSSKKEFLYPEII